MDQPQQTHKPKILIIDDNPSIVDVIRRILTLDGTYEPIVAYDGVEGLERFEAERPVCVIIDAKMPNLDGFQLLRCLRGDASTAETALIMLTALVRPNEQQTGLLSGADVYLTKPFRFNELLAAIQQARNVTPAERLVKIQELLNAMPPISPETFLNAEIPAPDAYPKA
jgi:DNA-binding response OmpR family regulator